MGRERYPKQSLGALYSRIKQVRSQSLMLTTLAYFHSFIVADLTCRRWGDWM